MGNKLYVGGLSYGTTTSSSRISSPRTALSNPRASSPINSPAGPKVLDLSRWVPVPRPRQRRRRLTDFDGRYITVNEARPQEKRSGFGGDRRGGAGRDR